MILPYSKFNDIVVCHNSSDSGATVVNILWLLLGCACDQKSKDLCSNFGCNMRFFFPLSVFF